LIAYVETSSLIKLLIPEEGSETADEIWRRASSRVTSQLVYPEARAALAAAERAGRIDERALRVAVHELDSACSGMRLIGADADLASHAGELAERHALRGYDAVHLATALSVNDPQLVLLSWDRDLGRAGSEVGFAVVPAQR
jgi:predicted nucleic acid-binding protein